MDDGLESLPDDVDALKAALVAARAVAAIARAQQSDDQALIAHLKLQIEKLNRDRYGPRSERTARLLDQLELTLEELEASATEDELAAEMAAARTANTTTVASFTRKRPSRQPFPDHLPNLSTVLIDVHKDCYRSNSQTEQGGRHRRKTDFRRIAADSDLFRPGIPT